MKLVDEQSYINLESDEEYFNNLKKCKDDISSDLVVAVMTVCGSVGSEIDLLTMFDYYLTNGCEFELNYVPNSKKSKDGTKNRAFYNCLSVLFYYKDSNGIESKIAAKIFPNGSIQLPGCRTIETVRKAPEILINFINDYSKLCPKSAIKNPELFKLQNIRIVMINSNFVFESGIVQERLKNVINEQRYEGKMEDVKVWRMATFQPEKYAGVNIRFWTTKTRINYQQHFTEGKKIPMKLDGQVSIFIFRSGKGTITGAKNTKDILEAFRNITDIVRNNKQTVLRELIG